MTLSNAHWKAALVACRRILGAGSWDAAQSASWCAFTTFASLEHRLTYWACGLPEEREFLEDRTLDGGLWRQSFLYTDLAHLIVPARFYWERTDGGFASGHRQQDLRALSSAWAEQRIPFRLTERVLELKLY